MSVAVVGGDREPSRVAEAVRAHDDVDAVEVRRLDAGDVPASSPSSRTRASNR